MGGVPIDLDLSWSQLMCMCMRVCVWCEGGRRGVVVEVVEVCK